MFIADTELLFPSRVILELRDLRGEAWQKLVDEVVEQEPKSIKRLAFTLMMVRLDGCVTCNSDSYRAMLGCTECACQNIRRFRESDQELIQLYQDTCQELAEKLP